MKRILDQRVIPAISSQAEAEQFLNGPLTVGILIDFHLSELKEIIDQIHQKKKMALVHLDLVKGISIDRYGCEYIIQRLNADGILSMSSEVIETAKQWNRISIQRMFLTDSKNLEKDIKAMNLSKPDFVELLPGLASEIFPQIKLRLHSPILGGGLIKTYEQIYDCLRNGASAVTLSSLALAEDFHHVHGLE